MLFPSSLMEIFLRDRGFMLIDAVMQHATGQRESIDIGQITEGQDLDQDVVGNDGPDQFILADRWFPVHMSNNHPSHTTAGFIPG